MLKLPTPTVIDSLKASQGKALGLVTVLKKYRHSRVIEAESTVISNSLAGRGRASRSHCQPAPPQAVGPVERAGRYISLPIAAQIDKPR